MLSFLKDQEHETNSAEQVPANTGEPGKRADTTATRETAGEQEYLTVASREKQVRKSSILLIILFCSGLLCLWFMVKKSVPQAAKAAVNSEEVQIETAIARLTGVKSEMYSRMDEIVKKFYQFNDVQQVQVSDLIKNPFTLDMFAGKPLETSESISSEERFRMEMTKQESKRMQLFSIMASNGRNCCMIDDKILYEGDSIKGFKVVKIGDNFVRLDSEGTEVILKLIQ